MHLVVLGAFGPAIAGMAIQFNQVLMHLVVLGAFYPSYWGVDE